MSNLVVPNVGKQRTLGAISGAYSNTPTTIRLYRNDYTPVAGSSEGSFTEANFTGYTSKSLTAPTLAGSLDASNRAVVTWDAVTWTKSGATGNTIYGYYCLNGSSELLWAERFDTPISMSTDGQFLTILPKLTDASQYGNT